MGGGAAMKKKARPAIKRSKYNAVATIVDGRRFHSKREANRYCELKLMQKAGVITDLQMQVPFFLVIKEKYIADFVYHEKGERVVEDVKGVITSVYRRKRKAMKTQHNIIIRET
jgi:hypothetical protein